MASSVLHWITRRRPRNTTGWTRLATRLASEGDPSGAIAAATEGLSTAVEASEALTLGQLLDGLNAPDAALEAYAVAARLDPHDPDSQGMYGVALRRAGRPAAAAEAFRRAVSARPDQLAGQLILGECLLEANDFHGAFEVLDRAARRDPEDPRLRFAQGRAAERCGRIDLALTALRIATRNAPNHLEGHLALGPLLVRAGAHHEAVACFEQIIERWPTEVAALIGAGLAHAYAGDETHATRRLQEAVRLAPNRAESHYNLGVGLSHFERAEAASAAFRTATVLEPRFAEAHLGLAQTLANRGLEQPARLAAETAMRTAGDRPIRAEAMALIERLDASGSVDVAPAEPATLTGTLSTFPVPDLLEFLRSNRSAGTLRINTRVGDAILTLHGGRVLEAEATGLSTFASRLVATGVPEQALADLAPASHIPLAQAVSRAKLLTPDALNGALYAHVLAVITVLVEEPEGSFTLSPLSTEAHGELHDAPTVRLDWALMEALRCLDESRNEYNDTQQAPAIDLTSEAEFDFSF
jgi:tetratricopeptide (TPR) repeat protein